MSQPGDVVKIVTTEKVYEGTLMPSLRDDIIVLKLPNGYNVGIARKLVTKQVTLTKFSPPPKRHLPAQKGDKPIVSILHTGGTIASRVSYETGGVIAQFTPEDLLAQFPELEHYATLRSRLVANMMSENMRFAHYNLLAKEALAEWRNGACGIIITHGTDTLHFTAGALAFLLPKFPIPILLVGAQRSSDRGSSDAAQNLLAAVQFITRTDYSVIGICMHKTINDGICTILPATRTRKSHTSRRDAFQPVDASPLADVVIGGTVTPFGQLPLRGSSWDKKLQLFDDKIKVGVLTMHPNMYASEFKAYKGYDGLLLLGTGLGHCPIIAFDIHTKEHRAIIDAITSLAKTTVLAMASQTGHGRVNMDVYGPGRMLLDAGVIGTLQNMTWETAFIKLAWLLSTHDKKEAKDLFSQNLVGEMSHNY
ncbi:Glu-tRNA(Gln) amidotransferase subunit GatD [Candidatus Woesearchaeota archaeon]|nr:Glu-tRNA(Gln) amidotransferase subunit GatD [Candidatus Woesearchaeota archaeon]